MLHALKALIVLGLCLNNLMMAATAAGAEKLDKPDMQKVYDEAVNWSKTKLDKMPDSEASHEIAGIGVCRGASEGEPLMIKPPCPKKQKQQIDDVIDAAIGQDTAQGFESSRNSHQDILSSSTNQGPRILVFVSFSMPKASLRALSGEAAKHNAVLVMRGLKGDSFKTTQQAFLELVSDSDSKNLSPKVIAKNSSQDMQGFEVNPELFKTYQIKKVPTFVLVKNAREISRLSGNVSLDFAAKKLNESI